MGSEMCIRDSLQVAHLLQVVGVEGVGQPQQGRQLVDLQALLAVCLLYTSDAADERSSVDLGGRRIIKKKKRVRCGVQHWEYRSRVTTIEKRKETRKT